MRNIVVSIVSVIILVLLALLLLPAFLSTDYLKAQVVKLVRDQSGLTLAIDGDVSLSFITGVKLATQNVSLQDQQGQQLFSVRQLDFGLALSPLLNGKADITGITLDQPVITVTQSGSNSQETAPNGQATVQPPQPQGGAAAPSDQTDQTNQTGQSGDIDLSALSIRRLVINDAQIVTIDDGGHASSLITGLDATIRIPDFNGSAEMEATLPYKGRSLSILASLANMAKAINGQSSRLDISLESDLVKAKATGDLALKSEELFTANYGIDIDNVTQFLSWMGIGADALDVKSASAKGSLVALGNEIRLPGLTMTLDKQTLKAAARIFTATKQERPVLRLAVDGSTFNFDEILKATPAAAQTGSNGDADQSASAGGKAETPPDISFLNDFDATLDARVGRLTYQGQSLRQVKLLAQVMDGKLSVNLKSANLANGSLSGKVSGNAEQLIWSGSMTARDLDIKELAQLAGLQSPLSGQLSADVNFAAQGLTADEITRKGNIAGTVTLQKGQYANPALQSAVPNRKTGTISDLSSRITITNLDDPIDISGDFKWNGDAIRYKSKIGLGEYLANQPVTTNISLEATRVSLALAGKINPKSGSLSGSKLTIDAKSSKQLLAWLGHEVNSGTPNLPVHFSGLLDLQGNRSALNKMELRLGQTSGSGNLVFVSGSIPALSGKLAFEKLDATPFMGNGQQQGQQQGQAQAGSAANSNSAGWDQSPIDFSGLNSLKADLAFTAKTLIARDITMGPVNLDVKVEAGQLLTTLNQIALYGGKGNGQITIDAKTKPARMAAKFTLSQLNMKPFLTDTIGMRYLAGKGAVNLDLTAQGASQADIIRQLNGTSSLEMRDGQIHGINIPRMLRSLQGNILDGWASAEAQTTDFSALTASFTFANGVASNNDLAMLSPLLRLSGAGSINLPQMTINYKATPKVIAKLKGQGGPVNADGVPIPIIIEGPLAKPRIYPDIPGILENPQAILQSLEQMGDTGKSASKAIQKIEKNVNKELQKQSEKLGVDLNQLLQPNKANKQNNNGTQQQNLGEDIFKDITKGLFGN
ncbi:AsmA family protein [uncultured Cohaesibacter sp.]|uniref:AsmA family protein n=1 Tax=uncultured Cohaesibacter sp. TaxID=1002546 RepID=UPI0029C8ED0F|nr:AsmA family protein [uncultured Cohaesibacter sp.]